MKTLFSSHILFSKEETNVSRVQVKFIRIRGLYIHRARLSLEPPQLEPRESGVFACISL